MFLEKSKPHKVKHKIATEQQSWDEVLENLPMKRKWAEKVLSRLKSITTISSDTRMLEVGAGGGLFLAACADLGYKCEGTEPWEEARLNATKLAKYLGASFHIADGVAEAIPYSNDSFDIVFAFSVIEHVQDVEKVFTEIYRVLKPGGLFWFNTASSMCPVQDEIEGFPFFGWYPDSLKRKIMHWAKDTKPWLVHYTKTPAINWFTSSKAHILLRKHEFRKIYDRWDLREENEGGRFYKLVLRLIRSSKFLKILADIIIPGCSYAALK